MSETTQSHQPTFWRKRPVTIEAMRYDSAEVCEAIHDWMRADHCRVECEYAFTRGIGFEIKTLEGPLRAKPGDWIIKGVAGEFYPCKPEIFEETYERV